MKILYILKSFAMKAGVERVMSDKINYLAQRGYDVVLLTYEQGDHPQAFPLHETVRHYRLDARFFKLGQYPLWQRPFRMRAMRRRFAKGLQQTVDLEQPDIIVTTTYSMKVLDIILALRTSARHIVESHVAFYTVCKAYDFRHHPLLRRLASLYDRRTLARISRCDRLVALTKGDAADWQRYMDHVDIIPNPVTCYPDTVAPRDGTARRIISVGRLHEQKGFDLLIDAFAQVAPQCPGWHIDIFGSGAERQALEQRIASHGLQDRIRIQDPTAHIYDEYQQSDFYVLSSRYEGFGLVLVEALSCGIPAVAFRCKYGPEEIIEDGVDGLLAEDGNTADLGQKILWMASHAEQRAAMGRRARQSAQRYRKDTVMQQWEQLFQQLVPTP